MSLKIELNKYKKKAGKYTTIGATDKREFLDVGIELDNKNVSGTFIQKDTSILKCDQKNRDVEILSLIEAQKKYDGLKQYLWNLIPYEKDEFTKFSKKEQANGYFIKSKKGKKIKNPIQACMHIKESSFVQNVHNVVIAEENSSMTIIAGCSTASKTKDSLHLGVSEFYVKKGATLIYTMIHDWGEKIDVRPRTSVVVEEGGTYISNYISLKPMASLQTNPIVTLNGRGAVARLNSIVVADEKTYIDVGGDVYLNAEDSKAEIISRAICLGGTIITKGNLVGNASNIKAHLECKGMILKEGTLNAIPAIDAKMPNLEMTHEASVGKIDKREIEYLMARGLDEETAVSTIVRGFLNVNIEGLPIKLKKQVDAIIEKTELAF